MHIDQQTYRTLYDAIQDYEGSDLYGDVVRPWLGGQEGERRWLESFAKRGELPVPAASIEDLWRLYAFSRIVDLFQLGFSPADRVDVNGWGTKPIGAAEYAEFMAFFGLHAVASPFHPFFHEIVTVEMAEDPSAPITIVREYWPAYMLGPMLITRAGCAVTAGADQLTKAIAENSTLYWAYARRTRPTADLSKGWGNNSSWRTSFRRDYLLGGIRHYHVDARREVRDDDDLDASERLELLRFRCFVRCTKPHDDRWPYDDSFTEE